MTRWIALLLALLAGIGEVRAQGFFGTNAPTPTGVPGNVPSFSAGGALKDSGYKAFPTTGGAITPTPAVALTLDQSQASGTTLLAFASTASLSVGQIVSGTNVQPGTLVQSLHSFSAQVTFVTTGSSSSGQTVIASTNINSAVERVTMQCVDVTNPGYIGSGNFVTVVTNGVSLALTSNIVTTIPVGDTISCDPVATLSLPTTAAASAGATINFIANATTVSATSAVYNGGDLSVAGNGNFGGSLSSGGPVTGFNLSNVNSSVAFPVPGLRPVAAGSLNIAFDILPKGTPGDYSGNGTAWTDTCNQDFVANGAVAFGCIHVSVWNDGHGLITTSAFNGATAGSLILGAGSVNGLQLDTSGNVTALGTFNAVGVYKANGTVGVSCAANTATLATLVITSGIVTHC